MKTDEEIMIETTAACEMMRKKLRIMFFEDGKILAYFDPTGFMGFSKKLNFTPFETVCKYEGNDHFKGMEALFKQIQVQNKSRGNGNHNVFVYIRNLEIIPCFEDGKEKYKMDLCGCWV